MKRLEEEGRGAEGEHILFEAERAIFAKMVEFLPNPPQDRAERYTQFSYKTEDFLGLTTLERRANAPKLKRFLLLMALVPSFRKSIQKQVPAFKTEHLSGYRQDLAKYMKDHDMNFFWL